MGTVQTKPWDAADHLRDDADAAAYLDAALEDGDAHLVAAALGDVAREVCVPARYSDMNEFAKRLQSDAAVAREFFRAVGILGDDGELAPAYRDP